MEAKLQKQIVDYFSFFEEFYNLSKTCLKDCQKCAITINKLIVRSKNIKAANVVDTPLEKFDNLPSRLCSKLLGFISEEVNEIRNHLSTIEDQFEKLCSKNKCLEETCKEINFEQNSTLIRGSPLQPPLKKLLTFVYDTITFGSEICAHIETTLDILYHKGLNTESISDSFKISKHWQVCITEILAYTSYCSENQI